MSRSLSQYVIRFFVTLVVVLCASSCLKATRESGVMTSRDFEFVSSGRTLSGILNLPTKGEARALVIFIHGTGMTDVRGENRYARLRQTFAELGIASLV